MFKPICRIKPESDEKYVSTGKLFQMLTTYSVTKFLVSNTVKQEVLIVIIVITTDIKHRLYCGLSTLQAE